MVSSINQMEDTFSCLSVGWFSWQNFGNIILEYTVRRTQKQPISANIYKKKENRHMILATDEDTKVKDAVALRFKELCEERNISPNALAVRSGVTPSTVYSMLDSSQQSVTVPTVKKLCDGLGITLVDFFNASIFTAIDQEIR